MVLSLSFPIKLLNGKIADASERTRWRGSVVWPNARAWKARIPKGIKGSNPFLSATKKPPCFRWFFDLCFLFLAGPLDYFNPGVVRN